MQMGGAGARVLVLLDSQIQTGNRHRTLQDEGVWMLGCRGRAGGFGHISGSSFAQSLWIVSSVVTALGWRLVSLIVWVILSLLLMWGHGGLFSSLI